mgnify:CR=1 FL=1
MNVATYQYHHCTTRASFKEQMIKLSGWEREYCENDILPYWDKNDWWDYEQPANIIMKVSDYGAGDVVAGLAYTHFNNKLHIKRLFTSIAHRKQGHAHDLLKSAWQGTWNNARYLRMYCDADAIPFYEKLGFKMLDVNEKGYGYVFQPMLFRDMDFTLKVCKNELKDTKILDDQDLEFISYDFQ